MTTDLHDLPGHLIRRMHQISVSAFAAETKAAGVDLTPMQFAALCMLWENPGIEQATLAGLVAIDRPTIGGVVARLEARGLLERGVSPSDRRARILNLTEAGAALLREARPLVQRAQDAMLGELAPDERDTLVALLLKATRAETSPSRTSRQPGGGPPASGSRSDTV
ncbi:MarR family winged helix-turn-helix transcriptional regulator [Salipiger sp.]|uniref:MarR family winged helix-turn-helix transcriptional regulator n=1 Tax=Salipiger sp. TaxID=2078585 RepID=UPI003A9818F0